MKFNCAKLFLITLVLFTGCSNFEVNTTDLQFSKSISFSKKNSLFEMKYCLLKNNSLINEVWAEYKWKYIAEDGERRIEKGKDLQLVITFNEKFYLLNEEYGIRWIIKDINGNSCSKRGDIFSIPLTINNSQETMKLYITNKTNNTTDTLFFNECD